MPQINKETRTRVETVACDDGKNQIANKLAERRVFDVSSEDTEYLKVISEGRAKIERCVDSSMP